MLRMLGPVSGFWVRWFVCVIRVQMDCWGDGPASVHVREDPPGQGRAMAHGGTVVDGIGDRVGCGVRAVDRAVGVSGVLGGVGGVGARAVA